MACGGDNVTALPPDQRARLVGAKLAALVDRHSGVRPDTVVFPGGAAALVSDTAWVLLDDRPATGLGGAVAWALRHEASRLAVVADTDAAVLARRAGTFRFPVTVWQVHGTDLVEASAAPVPDEVPVGRDELEAAGVFTDIGIDVVIEHGVVSGEVLGLEVARVVTVDGSAQVHPGVGRNDRDGHAMLLGADGDATRGGAARAALERVAADVRRVRHGVNADRHPLGRMARSRWLRQLVVADPALVGGATLEPVAGTLARTSVGDDGPAFAVGTDLDGGSVVVACTVGVDLDVIPAAADVRLAHDSRTEATSRLVVVLAERDLQPVTQRLAEQLVAPAGFVTVADDWHVSSSPRPGT